MSIVRRVDAVGVTGEDVVVQRSGGVDSLAIGRSRGGPGGYQAAFCGRSG